MNLSPGNGSVTAQPIGAVNAAVFECDIFHEDGSGESLQITTIWMLQNFQSRNQTTLVIQSDLFMVSGDPQPPGSFSETYRNRVVVRNFTEGFDGAVLICGTENQDNGYFNLRVYSKLVIAIHFQVARQN